MHTTPRCSINTHKHTHTHTHNNNNTHTHIRSGCVSLWGLQRQDLKSIRRHRATGPVVPRVEAKPDLPTTEVIDRHTHTLTHSLTHTPFRVHLSLLSPCSHPLPAVSDPCTRQSRTPLSIPPPPPSRRARWHTASRQGGVCWALCSWGLRRLTRERGGFWLSDPSLEFIFPQHLFCFAGWEFSREVSTLFIIYLVPLFFMLHFYFFISYLFFCLGFACPSTRPLYPVLSPFLFTLSLLSLLSCVSLTNTPK